MNDEEWNDEAEHKLNTKQRNRRSRNKGSSFERDTVNLFKQVFKDCRRNLEFQKEAAAKGIDLLNTGPYMVQCKAYKSYAPIAKIFEVKAEAHEIPVLITKGDRLQPMAVLPLRELIRLLAIEKEAQL